MRLPRRERATRLLDLWAILVLLSTLLQPCVAFALQLDPRHLGARDQTNSSIPSPVSVAPTQNWDGIDGKWNSFALRIGEPEQYVRVFISTANQQTWAIHSLACVYNATDSQTNVTTEQVDSTCFESRGRTFNISASTSWDQVGYYQLWTERNLGLSGNGQYGYDTVGFGQPGEEGPTLQNTTVGALITNNFWLGHFGVNAKPTNFSAFSDPSPSYMVYLFNEKYIPSLSFGYTAGAQYHVSSSVEGSLTLGGYDSSRFIQNDLTFGFAPDNERDIVVGVVGITANSATKTNYNLLARDSFTMYIDSTIAELWLPIEVCEAFEKAFGLTYDNTTGLYLVDNLLHQTLLAENASVTFSLGQKFATNDTVDIVLPYAAFDLTASPPYQGLQNSSLYFPIRRGAQENQFVLGRAFLQEAYLLVDWERQNFSVYQCSSVYSASKSIVPILSPTYVAQGAGHSSASKHLTTGAIIGIAVGGGFLFAMSIFGIAWLVWRRRQQRRLAAVKAEYEAKAATTAKEPTPEEKLEEEAPLSPVKDAEEQTGTNVFPKAELPGESVNRHELGTEAKVDDPSSPSSSYSMPSPAVEVDNTERPIFEMEGDMPLTLEAGGRQLSEKESMMVRERIYNGIDPTGPSPESPTSIEPPRRLAPLLPSDVAMVNRRLPNVSPTTPRTPTDGAVLEANDTFFQPPRGLRPEDDLLSPVSPLEGSTDSASRRRFSYESP